MVVVLTRNIDLSVGSIVGLSAYLTAATFVHHHGYPLVVVALIAVGIGVGLGLVNGLLVAVGRIPSIIATLATLAIYRGIDVRDHGRREHHRLPAAQPLPRARLDQAARECRLSPGSRSPWRSSARPCCAGRRGRGTSTRSGRTPTPRASRASPRPAVVITAFVISGGARRARRVHVRRPLPDRRRRRRQGIRARRDHRGRDRRRERVRRLGTRCSASCSAPLFVATIQDGFILLRISEFWRLFFNGFAIVVAVTLERSRSPGGCRTRCAAARPTCSRPGTGRRRHEPRGRLLAACSPAGRASSSLAIIGAGHLEHHALAVLPHARRTSSTSSRRTSSSA